MSDLKRQKRQDNLLLKIRECIDSDNYILTKHALERQGERAINLTETLYVLKNGFEDKRKTCFDEVNNKWKYAIRGKTLIENLDSRVVVAFDENLMLIITVMLVGDL